jgi:dTDP-4-amino-4,6-dideoxygalactose transaminase
VIPRHSLPIGVRGILSSLASPATNTNASDVETAYSDALGVQAVVLFPSVRAGIRMFLQAVGEPDTIIAGPVYTCSTVHEAMALGSVRTRLISPAADSFLMSAEGIHAASEPGGLLVLSEVYGIPYDQEMLQITSRNRPRLRIFDMAMSVPAQKRMQQLEAKDVALFSFGRGKPMYAGWGGVACLQDLELADRVREIRDRSTTRESSGLRFQRSCSTLISVVMNQRCLYGLSHQQGLYRLYRNFKSARNGHHSSDKLTIGIAPPRILPPAWTQPTTSLNRKLALHNLRESLQNAEVRRSQAEIYVRRLVEPGNVRGQGVEALPQSHFPIRLPAGIRDPMCDYLRGRGVDTGTLFPFVVGLSRASYPNAAEAADEVITLPLGPTITPNEVQMVSECVKDGLRAFGL